MNCCGKILGEAMKSIWPTAIIVLLFSQFASAGSPDSLSDSHLSGVPDSSRLYLTLAYDPNYMERVGTENVLTIHDGVTRLEDALLGFRWSAENSPSAKAGGVSLRFAKLVFLDLPSDVFTYVFAHEYFGHGARFRELTNNEVKYHFSPTVYGSDENWTYTVGSVSLSYQGMLAIREGGNEAQALLNRDIAMRWMSDAMVYYRDASLYFLNFTNDFTSTAFTSSDMAFIQIPNDAGGYLREIDRQSGATGWGNAKMSTQSFRSHMLLSLFNPFYFYSLYDFFKTYLWDGEAQSALPVIHIAGVRYLPVLKSSMTPFGIEYHLENYLRFGSTTSLVDLKAGDQTFYSSWGGIGVSCRNIASWNALSADVDVSLWKQPQIALTGSQVLWSRSQLGYNDVPPASEGGGFGGAASARAYYHFTVSDRSLAVIAEAGYKSVGFLEGYTLDASPIIAIGIGIQPW